MVRSTEFGYVFFLSKIHFFLRLWLNFWERKISPNKFSIIWEFRVLFEFGMTKSCCFSQNEGVHGDAYWKPVYHQRRIIRTQPTQLIPSFQIWTRTNYGYPIQGKHFLCWILFRFCHILQKFQRKNSVRSTMWSQYFAENILRKSQRLMNFCSH